MRLVIVSNRLPVTISESGGTITFKESVGGLATGIKSYVDSLQKAMSEKVEYIWIGWPGPMDNLEHLVKTSEITKTLVDSYNCYPVYIEEELIDKFYYGFCNKTIWPLFHYFAEYTIYNDDYWDAYKYTNNMFYKAVMSILRPDDIVWVHDYQLLLLPGMLRKSINNAIGFFLHIPFPDYEIFRLLPKKWAQEILMGILGADCVGFHTYSYTQYFLRCALYILGYSNDMNKIIMEDHIVKVDAFPMGIDFHKFNNAIKLPEVRKARESYMKKLPDVKIILSVDRLDYTKGILNRLYAFEKFLQRYTEWHEKVVLLLLVVPSRTEVEHYNEIKRQIDRMVGKINGEYGTVKWTPVIYLYRSEPFYRLVALYTISDIALITPLRDGMNLIAKEYIASRFDKTGVLILSEMAGAASELGETITVNPNDINDIVYAIKEALIMTEDEQIKRNIIMQKRLERYNVVKWATNFIKEMLLVNAEQKKFNSLLLNSEKEKEIVDAFKNAKKKVLFLDYDGTLVPFEKQPELAKPDEDILNQLKLLSNMNNTDVVIISGRDKDTLEKWFGTLNLILIAEHGIWIKEKGFNWKLNITPADDWKPTINQILEIYVDRLPQSFIEEKEYSLVWHYRKSDPEMSSLLAKELTDYLISFAANMNLQIMQGNKVIEIKNSGMDKGTAALSIISKNDYDFILAIGDDWTDEYLFKALTEEAYTIRVGMIQSYARFNIRDYQSVRKFLSKFKEQSYE